MLAEVLNPVSIYSDVESLLMHCRVCSQHGQALLALNIYDWMSTRVAEGGAGLRPTVFTYTAAMRAALAGNLIDRALKVWYGFTWTLNASAPWDDPC